MEIKYTLAKNYSCFIIHLIFIATFITDIFSYTFQISTDFLEDEITKFEDYVQSMDIAAFNKI